MLILQTYGFRINIAQLSRLDLLERNDAAAFKGELPYIVMRIRFAYIVLAKILANVARMQRRTM
jgi:hypothetical protein